jgi:hypothetical protein
MKKTAVLLLLTIFCAGVTIAQKKAVKKPIVQKIEKVIPPDAVVSAFKEKMQGDINPEWNKKSNGNYVAVVDNSGMKQYIEFTAEGKWQNSSSEIAFENLTEAAQASIKAQFAEMQVAEVKKIEREGISAFYKVKLTKEKEIKTVYVNDAGFISS